MRTIDSILSNMRDSLEESNSDLASFPEYGNLYAIFRAVAGSILEQDAKIDSINSNLFLNTAAGEALDFKANEFNLIRNKGVSASGSIIALGTPTTIPSSTILTDNQTGLQFRVESDIKIISNRAFGTISCTEYTELGNLKAGTELFNSVFSSVKFIIGTSFNNISNNYTGNLEGGRQKETDDDLKYRLLNTIQSLSLSNLQALTIKAQSIQGLNKVSIIENDPSLGYITVYVNNTESRFLSILKNELELIKPIGTALIIKNFNNVPVNIDIAVEILNSSIKNEIENRIQLNIQEYIRNLNNNSILTREALASNILKISGVSNVNIVTPTSNITIRQNEILNLNTLNISYL